MSVSLELSHANSFATRSFQGIHFPQYSRPMALATAVVSQNLNDVTDFPGMAILTGYSAYIHICFRAVSL